MIACFIDDNVLKILKNALDWKCNCYLLILIYILNSLLFLSICITGVLSVMVLKICFTLLSSYNNSKSHFPIYLVIGKHIRKCTVTDSLPQNVYDMLTWSTELITGILRCFKYLNETQVARCFQYICH